MTLAERTREAAAEHPFLVDALRAGAVNYAAAARFLDVDGDTEAVATALRRYGEALPDYDPSSRSVRVTMQSGLDRLDSGDDPSSDGGSPPDDALVSVGGTAFVQSDEGTRTAILGTGSVNPALATAVLQQLAFAGVDVETLAFHDDSLVAVVDRRAGANALRAVERAAESVPDQPSNLDP